MSYYQLFIINRSGGLIYSKSLSSFAPNLSTNDCLRLGSTFHGLHAIATQIAPVISAGIERLETDTFVLQCFQTLTGIKFVITAAPGTTDLDNLLKGIYEVYSDYVLKVQFYSCYYTIKNILIDKNLNFGNRIHFMKSICRFDVIYFINI
jgi:trafficking protein particle complex subunit 4